MFKVSHKKSYLKYVEIKNLKILRKLYFDFFFKYKTETAKTGQKQLLENR